jgi:hypothetical protein
MRWPGSGDYALHMGDPATMDAIRMTSIYLASVIGSVTATGSVVAFGKLQVGGMMVLAMVVVVVVGDGGSVDEDGGVMMILIRQGYCDDGRLLKVRHSVVAWWQGLLHSKALALPGRDGINLAMGVGTVRKLAAAGMTIVMMLMMMLMTENDSVTAGHDDVYVEHSKSLVGPLSWRRARVCSRLIPGSGRGPPQPFLLTSQLGRSYSPSAQ